MTSPQNLTAVKFESCCEDKVYYSFRQTRNSFPLVIPYFHSNRQLITLLIVTLLHFIARQIFITY